MARKISMLDNPLGLVTKRYPACRVKGGERTHILKSGAALCGAGRSRDGRILPGALIRSGKKVARGEIDCLRCVKILKLDPELTGEPTTVEYDGPVRAGGKPKRSKTGAIVLRKFRPSAEGKRKEHVMVVGGRAGAYIAKRQPKGRKSYRRSKEEMSVWEKKRAYIPAEVTTFGPAYITAYEPDGTPARHKFRRGSDKHPTQTKLARKPWLTRQPGSAAPRPVVRRPAREEIAVVANPHRRNSSYYDSMESLKAANKAAGLHWFDRDTLRFFASKIETPLYAGRYFVTSEKTGFDSKERAYSVREAGPNGKISTVGDFGQFATKQAAIAEIKRRAAGHLNNPKRKNPSVSFKTADGRTVSFKTKAKKR